jgi:ABC-2 type transport system permease protein
MTPASVEVPGTAPGSPPVAPAAPARPRPFYWSVRRELWENRSIYLAPLLVAAFAVVALMIHAITMPSHMRGMLANDPVNPGVAADIHRVAAMLLLVTAFVVAVFYSLEALSGERRDRSILFWKSLPVSDLATVLAKASIPLVVLPLVTFAVIVAAQLTLALLSTAALLVQGHGSAPLWRELRLLGSWGSLLYAIGVIALWHAPIYAFLLLASGWARRTAALWAVLPLLAAGVLEKALFNTPYVWKAVKYRLIGWYGEAFAVPAPEHIPFSPANQLTPGHLLSTPELWIGLALAVVLIAAAVRLRRYRAPI